MPKFVELTSTNAAKLFGMYPRKGSLAIGSDADLIIFDPEKKHTISKDTHHMNVDYSAYEGWELTGKTEKVIMRGQLAIDNGEVLIDRGYGQFIFRNKVDGKT